MRKHIIVILYCVREWDDTTFSLCHTYKPAYIFDTEGVTNEFMKVILQYYHQPFLDNSNVFYQNPHNHQNGSILRKMRKIYEVQKIITSDFEIGLSTMNTIGRINKLTAKTSA